MFFLLFLCNFVFASPDEVNDSIVVSENRIDYQVVQVYVDISEIIAPDGSRGTSLPLNVLLADRTYKPDLIRRKLQYWSNPVIWNGEVNMYDWTNVMHMPTFSKCDYSDAISCGIKNRHWTLKTVILIGNKFSTITMKMYNEKGMQIGKGSKTTWGKIWWKPKWKLTTVKEQGPLGAASREIFEMWPPTMEEIPPLVTPFHIGQAVYGALSVEKRGCNVKSCR